jgi:hypothetical protein
MFTKPVEREMELIGMLKYNSQVSLHWNEKKKKSLVLLHEEGIETIFILLFRAN